MKVSLKWIREYVDVPSDIKAFCDRLDLTGTGVEGVEETGNAFENIVTAKVVSKEHHPDSDHMWVCMVDVGDNNLGEDGTPEPLQIVCGAQNFNAGDHIVTALVGAKLPGDVKIKKSKLRGVVSNGMNCSGRELGLSNDHEGILILPEDAPIGVPFSEYLDKTDIVLDLEITPNRPDCLSITGLAREIGAMYETDWHNPLPEEAAKLELESDGNALEDLVSVAIEDSVRCPRYTVRVIRDVKVGPSPDWMVERLAAIGQRSINNVVDVTNYILFLYGQPLHSFDFDKMKNKDGKVAVEVRAAHEGEKLLTLDGVERDLTEDMTVIATPEAGAVGLAGVMGGMNTEVTEDTTCVLLEAATFEPGRTSRTSRNLNLISESSLRYERGVDDHGIDERSAAACALLAEVAGGRVVYARDNNAGIIDVWPNPKTPPTIVFRKTRFNEFVGAQIPGTYCEDSLTRLGCTIKSGRGEDVLEVVAPTFRPDLEREADLYEEVLRLWGMDRIVSTLPASPHRVGRIPNTEQVLRIINNTLRASGMNETMTYSFADVNDIEKLGLDPDALGIPVELLNPLNTEQSVMRQSMLPGLLRSVEYNLSRGVKNIQLYEIGTVFIASDGKKKPKEISKLGGVLAGSMQESSWNNKAVSFDFFDGKGILENLARELALPKVRFKALSAEEAKQLQPGRAAQMLSGSAVIGWIGEIHPLVAQKFEIDVPVVAFELDIAALTKCAHDARPYVDVPMYPAIEIDQNFVVAEDVTNERLVQVMTSAGGSLLEGVKLFDVYRDDERVGKGMKSMAYSLTYRSSDRTLTADEVEKAHSKLVRKVEGACAASVRSE